MIRVAVPTLALLVGLALSAAVAHARELPPEVRRMAERAFLEGRLDDLDVILAGAEAPLDRFPLELRDRYWRMTSFPGPSPRSVPQESHLHARRLAWLMAPDPEGPYPEAGSGGDPYPILTALVLDRQRRERRGHAGLPQEGPLEALARELDPRREKRAIFFAGEWTRRLMSLTYRGPPPNEEKVGRQREAEDLRVRNGTWALVAVGAFLLLALIARWIVDRAAPSAVGDA